MTYITLLSFVWFIAGFKVAGAIPLPPRKTISPCQMGVQSDLGYDDTLSLINGCRKSGVRLTPSLSWMGFLIAAIVVLALAAIAVARAYRTISSHSTRDEHDSLENGPPQPTSRSPLLNSYLSSSTTLNNHSRYQSTSASVHFTQNHQQAQHESRRVTAQASQASLAVSNLNTFAPSLTDSPKQQSTKSLEIPNLEQTTDTHRRTSAGVQQSNLEVLVRSFSTTIDDQISTTFQHSVLHNEALPENGTPADSGQAQPVSQTQPESGRRAETVPPNFVFRSASRQHTLLRSLIGLASMQPTRPIDIKILGIGLSWDDTDRALPGPTHDIRWLDSLFENDRYIQFSHLLNHDATYEAIRKRVEETYRASSAESYLIVYFAGHGTEDNSLELYEPNSGSINEVVLNNWIVELRQTTSKHIPVYIVFDFCRTSPVQPNLSLAKDVHIIWACSPRQEALDLDWSVEGALNKHLPRSCFLMALVLAVHDASTNSTLPAWKHFAIRLKELVNVVRGSDHWGRGMLQWPSCRCRVCLGGDICPNARDSESRYLFQVVSLSTLEANPDFSAVARFVARHFPLRIQQIVRHVSNDHWIMFFNPVRITMHRGSLQPRRPEFLRNISAYAQIIVRHMTAPILSRE